MKNEIISGGLTLAACFSLNGCSYVTKQEMSKEISKTQIEADEAKATAAEALALAKAADEKSNKTEIVVERSFKKSMYK